MTSSTRRGLSRLSVMLSAPFLAVSAAQAQTAPQGTIDRIKARGTFLAGVRYDFPPVGSLDTSGRPTGFGPDLAKAFADKLGVRVEYVQVTSRNRFALLQNNGIDADIGPTTPTVQREDVVDFTTPYVWDSCVLIVKRGTSGNVADYGPPRRIATTQGSLLVDYVKSEVPTAQFVFFQEYPDAITALLSGRADAVATNTFSAQSYVALRPQLLEVGTPFYNDPWAIGLRENDSKWRNFLDITMQEMWHRGEYQTMFARHFGAPPAFKMWSEYRLQPGIGA